MIPGSNWHTAPAGPVRSAYVLRKFTKVILDSDNRLNLTVLSELARTRG